MTPTSGESNVRSYADGRSPPVCSEGTDFSPNTNHQSTSGLEQTRIVQTSGKGTDINE